MHVKPVRSMGWTRSSVGVSVLLALESHRREVGQRVLQMRKGRRWTAEDLAHKANVSVKTISRIENGHHEGRTGTMRRVAKALGISEAELLGAPPAPLGLGAADELQDQLDRIEAKLEEIRELLTERPEGEGVPAPPGELGRRSRAKKPTAGRPPPPRKKRAADSKPDTG